MQLLPTTYTLRRRDTTDHTLLIYREYLHAILPEMTDYTVWFHDTLLKQIFSALNGIIWFLKNKKKTTKGSPRVCSKTTRGQRAASLNPSRCPYTRLCEAGWGVVPVRAEHAALCLPVGRRISAPLSPGQLRPISCAHQKARHPPSSTLPPSQRRGGGHHRQNE